MEVQLKWITPDAEKTMMDIVRLSSDPSKVSKPDADLLRYLREHQHWSPFEMVSACFSIRTTRDIARQILRHRSFSFQEFSQRYADVTILPMAEPREARLQDTKNRQNSIELNDVDEQGLWEEAQDHIWQEALMVYKAALDKGIAKEVARSVLPEGLTPSHMYMSGTIRSWLHYCDLRCGNGTQKEHQRIARKINNALVEHMPNTFEWFYFEDES